MRFTVEPCGTFVRDTFTNTRTPVESIVEGRRVAMRLNDYMITHENNKVIDGFSPTPEPKMVMPSIAA